jgi:hypothetical protein
MNSFLEEKLAERLKIIPEMEKYLRDYCNILDKQGISSENQFEQYLNSGTIDKRAYPQGIREFIHQTYNIPKWTKALQDIYQLISTSQIDYQEAFNKITYGWDDMEKIDFKNWVSYYQQGNQNKYKTAQYYPNNFKIDPNEALKAQIIPTQEQVEQQPQLSEEEKKKILAKRVQSVVARLNAAEKIAAEPDVRDALKKLDLNLDDWFARLHQVKRMIQIAPIKSIYSTLLQDIIIKEANILVKQGFPKAAKELIFIAQDPSIVPPPISPEEPASDPLEEFIKAMNFEDDSKAEDHVVLEDENDIVDPQPDDMDNIKVLAQAVQSPVQSPSVEPTPNQPAIQPAPDQEVVEPNTEEIPQEDGVAETEIHKKTDDLFEAALSDVTVDDAVARLEVLANLFRTREIPRQLSIVDLIFDKLNIASFFPSLAEASSKMLDSNQYALTRIEEILSKLRGVIRNPESAELDLVGKPITPTLPNIQKELANQMELERQLKDKRKKETQLAELAEPLPAEPTEVAEAGEEQSALNELSVPPNASPQQPAAPPVNKPAG